METTNVRYTLLADRNAHLLLTGLVLGVAGDILLWESEVAGPGISIWIFLLCGATYLLNNRAESAWRKVLVCWSAVAFSASLLLVLRASMNVLPLVLMTIVMSAVLVLLQASGGSLVEAKLRDYFRSGWRLPIRVLPGLFPVLASLQWQGLAGSTKVLGLVKGALLATPLLFIFITLFASADANFDRYVAELVDTLSFAAPQHLLFILFVSWISIGLLRCTLLQRETTRVSERRWQLGAEETAMIMGSLALLFISFVVLQASYLFGGQSTLALSTGLTAAEYARRGFFELILVGSLTLAVLLGLSASENSTRIFRPLAVVLIVCVFVIFVSAIQRLSLYIDSFGLSLSRVFAAAFMIWLAGNILSFALTCLRGNERGFASGLVLSGIAAVFILVLANPAAIVARVNLNRSLLVEQELDLTYLLNLGPDAVPVILSYLPRLKNTQQCEIANAFLLRYGNERNSSVKDWRSWNYGREHSNKMVANAYDELYQLSGREKAMVEFKSLLPVRSAIVPLCGAG